MEECCLSPFRIRIQNVSWFVSGLHKMFRKENYKPVTPTLGWYCFKDYLPWFRLLFLKKDVLASEFVCIILYYILGTCDVCAFVSWGGPSAEYVSAMSSCVVYIQCSRSGKETILGELAAKAVVPLWNVEVWNITCDGFIPNI